MKNLLQQFGIVLILFISLTSSGFTKASKERTTADVKKDQLIGNLIRSALETYHYKSLVLNDKVSLKAFDEYVKKIDYGKQFLYKSDVEQIRKYNDKFDDQLLSGNNKIVELSTSIINQRVDQAEKLRGKFFEKKLNFTADETLELDPEKITWVNSEKEFNTHWKKLFTHFTLSRYLSLVDENKDDKDKTKKDKKKSKN